MTISTSPRVSLNCDGVTKVFPVAIQAYQNTDLTVILSAPASAGGTQATLVLNSDYSLATSGTLQPTAWTLTTLATAAYAAGYTLQIFINPIQQQQSQYVQGQAFPSLAIQTNLDRLTQMVQRLQDEVSRCIHAPDGDVGPLTLLPIATQRALLNLGFDANGNVSVNSVLASGVLSRGTIGGFLYPRLSVEAALTLTDQSYVWFDVRRYGALGDGLTDDSAAFVSANTAGLVLVTGGLTYLHNTSVTLTAPLMIVDGTISVNPTFNLTMNGPVSITGTKPFTGNGGWNFGTAAKPGRVVNVLPDRASGVPVYGSAPFFSFGDSYTAGTGATAATCYAAITAARFNGVFTNLGISGTGVTKTMTQAFGNLPPYHLRGRALTWMAGFNDLHFYGNNAPTMQKIQDVTRAFLANAFLKFAVPANDASVTQTGAWTAVTPGTWGDKASSSFGGAGGRGLFTSVSTARLDWTFTGESVVVGTWNGNGSTYTQGQFDVYIDGTFVETRTPLGASDGNLLLPDHYEGLSHTALVYTGLGSGSHTISVRLKTANISMFDYFGTLAAPGECPSVLVGEICHVDATGYAGPEVLRTKAIDDAGTAQILISVSLFAQLGYPVAMVPCNDYYNANTNIFTDHDHPNPTGHLQISQAFTSRAYPALVVPVPGCSLTLAGPVSIANATSVAVIWSASVADTQGFWVAGTPTQFLAPYTGTLRISGTIVWAQNTTGVRLIELYKNGGGTVFRTIGSTNALASGFTAHSFCLDVPVTAGDFFTLKGTQNSGIAITILAESQLDLQMIR